MSGGHFSYQQFVIRNIIDEIELVINDPDNVYDKLVIDEFKKTVNRLEDSLYRVNSIDHLLSGDSGVDTFLEEIGDV